MSWNNDAMDPADLGFDVGSIAIEERSFELLKPGPYRAIVTSAEVKATQKGGRRVAVEVTITEGESKGRKVFDSLNIVVPGSDKATQIGRQQIASLFRACGVGGSSIVDVLQAQAEVVVVVGIEPARGEYEARNKIKAYKPVDASAVKPATSPSSNKPSFLTRK